VQADEEDEELSRLWASLPQNERVDEDEEIDLSDFLEADDRLATDGAFTLEEIVEEVLYADQDGSDDGEAVIEQRKISTSEAQSAMTTIRMYLEENGADANVMKACDQLEDKIHDLRVQKLRQPTIMESFGRRV
jgi:hypothetical protein